MDLVDHIGTMLRRYCELDPGNGPRGIQGILFPREPVGIDQTYVWHHVLKTSVGQPDELKLFGQREIKPNFSLRRHFASNTRSMAFYPTRLSQSGAKRPQVYLARCLQLLPALTGIEPGLQVSQGLANVVGKGLLLQLGLDTSDQLANRLVDSTDAALLEI